MSFVRSFLPLSAVLCLLALSSCESAEHVPGAFPTQGQVVATVNGQRITRPMMDAVLRTLPANLRAQVEKTENASSLMEGLVTSEIMYQEAMKAGLQNDPLVKEQLAMAERNALAEALLQKVVTERLTDDKISAWYKDHLVQFARPQVRLAHIVVTDGDLAASIKKQLDEGADFAELAKTHSLDTETGPNGGDLGWMDLRQLADSLRGVLADAKAGESVGPLELGPQHHVFKVLERREQQPLEDVRDDIAAQVENDLRQDYLQELRDKAVVVETGNAPIEGDSEAFKGDVG